MAASAFALAALLAFAPGTASAEESSLPDPQDPPTPIEGRRTLDVTGHALLIGGGLALLPAAYVGGTVAAGAFDSSATAESAAKDFQQPIVFAPLAAGFVAVMVGAAMLLVANPPSETPRAKKTALSTPFAFTF